MKKYAVSLEFESLSVSVEANSKEESAKKVYHQLGAYNLAFEDFSYRFDFELDEGEEDEDYFEHEY